jgi:hypothetical protein
LYSQFELIKIKLKKVNYNFLLFLGGFINLMSVTDLLRKSLTPSPRVAQAKPVAEQKTPRLPRVRRLFRKYVTHKPPFMISKYGKWVKNKRLKYYHLNNNTATFL